MATNQGTTDVAASVAEPTSSPELKSKAAAPTKASAQTPSMGTTKKAKKKKEEVVDSWEDAEISSDDDDGEDDSSNRQSTLGASRDQTAEQPSVDSTPSYPSTASSSPAPFMATWSTADSSGGSGTSTGPSRRPEKTDVVARRLIAGALGIRAPRLTEEQKAYERAAREAERKRREEERAAQKLQQEETERAKKAVWDD